MEYWLERYNSLIKKFEKEDQTKIPLCAAETYTSNFSLKALNSHIEGKYGFGTNDFIGGNIVLELKKLCSDLCKEIFNSKYSNFDTMTGMSSITYTIMALLNFGDNVLITTPNQGGHPSLPIILETLGITFDEMPYSFENYQIDYDMANIMLNTKNYNAIIFCQSDLLAPPELECFNFLDDTMIIYDCTQTLGLIAGNMIKNPMENWDNIVLLGGTHKTLPSPSCGIIMSNNDNIISKLDGRLSPGFLRYIQPNHIAALILSLIEFKEFGNEYCKKIQDTNLILSNLLIDYGFKIAKISDKEYSKTHQIFMLTSEEEMERMFDNANRFNVTLNKKHKQLFKDYGIRLGVQQISQYGWNENEIQKLAQLLYLLSKKNPNYDEINVIRKFLISKKVPVFSYDNCVIE